MADWDGTRYGMVSDLQRAAAAESLALIDLDGGERVLDVGCGDGYVTAQIAERLPGGSVLGVDPSPRMIEVARRRTTSASFVSGDVTSLVFDGEFDVVTSFNALHWVQDQDAAYRCMASALTPRGRAYLTFVCAGPRLAIEEMGMIVARQKRWGTAFDGFTTPYRHPTPENFAQTATAAGFEIVAQTVVDRWWEFGSRDAFARWCTVGFGDWTSHLGPDEAPLFIDAVVDCYRDISGRDDTVGFYQLRATLKR
ncbi:class I SAM-dependent methyltransferase [Mycolicibacterium sp. BiH015]|uniref:class I SAM-dependent methyltransferase n=1 Tax=Mycolicibacterium sp. BiH015 TaxID=3018808 RepID=UPI0022E01770|nr:class I SAM-dependent methyltransferase [Mycolicibacterium sp. BiH015]MDA2892739.1 class I SAM-dependent methyltransferase [Mycolicibacterium sp. BiH015]